MNKNKIKKWFDKIGKKIAIIAGICGILGISVFGGRSIFKNHDAESTNYKENEINSNNVNINGEKNIVIQGSSGDININVKDSSEPSTPEKESTDTVKMEKDSNVATRIVDTTFENKVITPHNPVKTNMQIDFEISSSSYPEEEIGIYNNDEEKELLYKAKELCENQNYDEAIAIYVCDILKDNPYAKINLGYLYAHGYGYDEDVETALKIYDSIDMDIAKRNKLALLITSNTNGNNDIAIHDLIDYFTHKNDYYVQNYITNCLYCKNVESLSDEEKNVSCTLEDLYVLETLEPISSTKTYYLNHVYKKLVYQGMTYNSNENDIMSAYYNYNVYQYMYLDWLEKIYA